MSLFKRKKEMKGNENTSVSNKANTKEIEEACTKNEDGIKLFERDLIQVIVLTMVNDGIIHEPSMKFLYNDNDLFEGLFTSHINDQQMKTIKMQSFDTYLMILGCHAIGAGMFAAMYLIKNKDKLELSNTEVVTLSRILNESDAYEIGLKAMKISPNSNNKKCFDDVIMKANSASQKLAGDNMKKVEYQKIYMKNLYNAGITAVLGK